MEKQMNIRALTQRFFDGETTLHEEQSLYKLYADGDVPDDLIGYREMMLGLKAMNTLSSSVSVSPEKPSQVMHPKSRILSFKTLSIAASMLLLLSWGVWHSLSTDDECVAYIYGERVTNKEVVMQEMQLAISGISDNEASEAVETQLKDLFD